MADLVWSVMRYSGAASTLFQRDSGNKTLWDVFKFIQEEQATAGSSYNGIKDIYLNGILVQKPRMPGDPEGKASWSSIIWNYNDRLSKSFERARNDAREQITSRMSLTAEGMF